MMRAPRNAGRNPATSKPSTNEPTNQKRAAFKIKVKRPSVARLRGKVKSNKIGFSVIFTTPRISAAMSAGYHPVTVIPGTYCATRISVPAVIAILRMSRSIILKLDATLPDFRNVSGLQEGVRQRCRQLNHTRAPAQHSPTQHYRALLSVVRFHHFASPPYRK